MPLVFELTTSPGTVTGTVEYHELNTGGVFVPNLTNPNPAQIHDDQDWEVRLIGLTQTGAQFLSYAGNQWRFTLYVEMLGGSEHVPTYQTTFPVIASDPHVYATQTINIPALSLAPGLYKLYAELLMVTPSGHSPIAGADSLLPTSGTVLQIMKA
ncbi:MAG: hypothetical protein ACOYNO_10045 [Saprospiraceae bacterium]